MPIGLMDISAYLRENLMDINISILDIGKDLFRRYEESENTPPVTLEEFIEMELDTVDFKPDIAGISILFSTAHKSSILIARAVKKRWINAIVVCGGNHATNFYRNLLVNHDIDYIVRGEAELSFTEFVKNVQDGGREMDIFGVIDRHKLENMGNELSPMIENLDELPLPAFDLLDAEFYKKTVGASLMFSRGCSFRCAFCASHTVHGRTVRFKSKKRIIAEFARLINELGFNKIIIEDDLFAARKDNFLEVADNLCKEYRQIKFFLPQGLSVSVLNEEIVEAMIKIGINEAAVAIESGSEFVQRHIIKKNVSLTKARGVLEYLRKKDFFTYVNFIFGFPGETKELIGQSISFINTIDVDWVYIFHALPLPGSEIYEKLVKQGVINPDNFDWDGLRLGRRVFDTPEIDAQDLEKLVYDTNINCNFFENSNLKKGRYKRAIDIFNRIILGQYPFHIVGLYCRGLAYLGLKERKKADTDFKACVKWIHNNAESKKLYQRYGEKMVLLKQYKNDDTVQKDKFYE